MAYQNLSKVQKDRRNFMFDETVSAVFEDGNRERWMDVLCAPFPQDVEVRCTTTKGKPNLFSPLHLIVDALAAKHVWSFSCHSLTYQGYRAEIVEVLDFGSDFFDEEELPQ